MYVPSNGNNNNPSKIQQRRSDDDKAAHEYVTNMARVATIVTNYMGCHNVCHRVNDMTSSPEFWFDEGCQGLQERELVSDVDDRGFAGTTART